GGQKVVVKVQRPTAERDISQDLRLLEMLAEKAGRRAGLRRALDLPAMIEHLSSSLRRELDFRQEAGNLERMREVLEPYPRPAVRELMLLLLLAFAHGDAAFLAEATLTLAGEDGRADELDLPTFQAELGELIARYRTLKLSEIQLGPLLQEVTEVALRHRVRV